MRCTETLKGLAKVGWGLNPYSGDPNEMGDRILVNIRPPLVKCGECLSS